MRNLLDEAILIEADRRARWVFNELQRQLDNTPPKNYPLTYLACVPNMREDWDALIELVRRLQPQIQSGGTRKENAPSSVSVEDSHKAKQSRRPKGLKR